MTKNEYKTLIKHTEVKERFITIDDLYDKSDRTLIHGYTLERDTFDVFISDGKIFKTITKFNQDPVYFEIKSNGDYIPSKRIYPDASDFIFCWRLQELGYQLPFTTFRD